MCFSNGWRRRNHVCLLACLFSGERWYQELQVRLFCRQVLLDQWPNHSDCQFWLTLLLRPWPIASQAHLLLILYGPQLPDGEINFTLSDQFSAVCVSFTVWEHINWNYFYFVTSKVSQFVYRTTLKTSANCKFPSYLLGGRITDGQILQKDNFNKMSIGTTASIEWV